jgi:hypothetical protein
MVIAPPILLHSPPRGRPQVTFQSVVPDLLEAELLFCRAAWRGCRSLRSGRPASAGPTSPTATRSRRVNSRPRSTDPNASARFRMHAAFASASPPGTTPSTITAASACSRPNSSITAGRLSHQPTPSCPEPGFRTESQTLRPGASPTTGTAYRRVDQSAARAGGNLTGQN